MLKIEWKQSAKKDFIAIVEYISQENLLAAETFIEVVEDSLELLKAHPKAGKIVKPG
ncbi:type II toxin-antitoxin system RelE/ParE family toxin [Idiomarina piscisalsi]|uniref:type II toxin-antitoxin system RelE/ParE family toxin n=1 Tax=Idiomarina piscisalsi TaxID=1096243 RepID=UPI001300966C|nr:type II toxin-antitoxin system RelE/ParE family toxin [Idiomarina piscisalsi]